MRPGWVYILECSDGTHYTGATSDLAVRLEQHRTGYYAGYTSSRLPVTLVFSHRFNRIDEAIQAERQIKRWSGKKKKALVNGDIDLLHELAECRNRSHCRYRR